MKIETLNPQSIASDTYSTRNNPLRPSDDPSVQGHDFKAHSDTRISPENAHSSVLSQREAASLYMLFGGEQPSEQRFYGQNKAIHVDVGNFIDVAG